MNPTRVPVRLPDSYRAACLLAGRAAVTAHRARVDRYCTRVVSYRDQAGELHIRVERRWRLWLAAWAFLLVSTPLVYVLWLLAALAARPSGFVVLTMAAFAVWGWLG